LRRPAHSFTTAVAIVAILAFGVLPPEHVHATEDRDGHHSEIIHRHLQPHHQSAPDTAVGHDDDDDAQWLITAFTASKTTAHPRPGVAAVALAVPLTLPDRKFQGGVPALYVSVHDPPWVAASGLRAPPASRL